MALDRNWRSRVSVISLAEALVSGTSESGISPADPLVLKEAAVWFEKWLMDNVFSVREAAAFALPRFASKAGDEWTQSVAWPLLESLLHDSKYMFRISGLMAVAAFCQNHFRVDDAVKRLAEGLDDKVSNVRLAALQAAGSLANISSLDWSKLKLKIDALAESDSDFSVSSFARRLTRST